MTPEQKYGPFGPGEDPTFQKTNNVRELGGYQTVGGRTVRHGLIWRSAALAWLSPAEREGLVRLGLRFDLDLRSGVEVEELPDPQLPGVAYERVCAMLDARNDEVNFSPEGIARILEAQQEARGGAAVPMAGSGEVSMDSPQAQQVMNELYVGMAFGSAAYRALFAHLEAGDVPILFHCTAGKDRTGVAAMLVLLALGVSEEDALYEYLLTNAYRVEKILEFARQELGDDVGDVPELPEEILMRAGVSERMGRAVLGAILARYGCYETYFEAEYGLDAARIAALRDRFTE